MVLPYKDLTVDRHGEKQRYFKIHKPVLIFMPSHTGDIIPQGRLCLQERSRESPALGGGLSQSKMIWKGSS